MMQMRAVETADIAALLPMVQALARHHGDEPLVTPASLARDLFGPAPWAQAIVADHEARLIGYALLLPLLRVQYGQRGMDLHQLFVIERARSQGVGAALLAAARAHAVALGCHYLTVSTQEHNAEARDFYIHHGFSPAPPSPWRFAMDLSNG